MVAFGIQSLSLALTASMVFGMCAILGGVSISAGDESTDDAREAGDNGIATCFDRGSDSVETITSSLLFSILSTFDVQLTQRIQTPSDKADEISKFLELLHPDQVGRPDFLEETIQPLMFAKQLHLADKYGGVGLYLQTVGFSPNSDELRKQYNDSWGGVISYLVTNTSEDGIYEHSSIMTKQYKSGGLINSSSFAFFGTVNSQGLITPNTCNGESPDCTVPLRGLAANVGGELVNKCYNNAWSDDLSLELYPTGVSMYAPIVSSDSPFVMLQSCRSMSHPLQINKSPRQGNRIGHIDGFVDIRTITALMKAAVLPVNALLYAIEKHPWTGVVSTLAGSNVGETFWNLYDPAGNWTIATPFAVINHTLDGTVDGPLSPIARHGRNMTAVARLRGLDNYYEELSRMHSDIQGWTDPDTTILYWTSTIKLTYSNINWYICLLVPRVSVTGTIDAAVAEIKLRISEDRDKADEDRTQRRTIMYAVASSCIVALMIVAYVLTGIIISPLKVVIDEMALVAMMQTEFVDLNSSLSSLTEVNDIQTSFRAMVKNLIEFRNYMPQSILRATDSDDDFTSVRNGEADARSGIRSAGSRSSATSYFSQYHNATDTGLRSRVVSVVMFNAVGWHSINFGGHDVENESMIEYHSLLVEAITMSVDTNKGVCDSFTGDRVMAHFNTVRSNSEHKSYAVKSGLMAQRRSKIQICFAATSGSGKIGNVGITGMKKFSIFSTAVPYAATLEKLASVSGFNSLVDNRCYEYSRLTVDSRAVLYVLYAKRSEKPCIVYESLSIKEVKEEEWMYQINNVDGKYHKWNVAILDITNGRYEEAEEMFDSDSTLVSKETYNLWRTQCRDGDVVPLTIK